VEDRRPTSDLHSIDFETKYPLTYIKIEAKCQKDKWNVEKKKLNNIFSYNK